MNHYTFDEIALGHIESFATRIGKEQMELFQVLTGDENPLHTNTEYASMCGFSGCVVYGMLTASYLSTLAGMYLPGMRALIHSMDISFPNALVLETGEVTISGTVIDKNETFKILTIKVQVLNATKKKVLRGTMKVGVRD